MECLESVIMAFIALSINSIQQKKTARTRGYLPKIYAENTFYAHEHDTA
jgi:hypothetical protein